MYTNKRINKYRFCSLTIGRTNASLDARRAHKCHELLAAVHVHIKMGTIYDAIIYAHPDRERRAAHNTERDHNTQQTERKTTPSRTKLTIGCA